MKSTVLIVDDESQGRETLEALLEPLGYSLVFASNGEEALEKAQAAPPDLILLDLMMPEMNGFETCRHLRTHSALAAVPIIVVTSMDDRSSRLQALEAGADDFLTKPIDRVELRTRVRTTTRLNRYRRLLIEQAKFERIAREAPDGFLVIDSQAGVQYTNPRARYYLGIPANEEVPPGTDFRELAGRHYRLEPEEAWAEWDQGELPAGKAPQFLVRPETRYSESFWLQVDLLRLPEETGAPYLIRLHDLSQQVASRYDMSRFHHYVAHKLRTPMNGLVGCVEMLADATEEMSLDCLKELANISLSSVRRLDRDIGDILDYIHLHEPRFADQGMRLNEFKARIYALAESLGLRLVHADLKPGVEHAVMRLSPITMDMIMDEIFSNSKKFHPEGNPEICVMAEAGPNGTCHLRIEDDGLTLSPEQLRRVWRPYFQCERHFTGEVDGMGLGLSMVAAALWSVGGKYRMVNRSDGRDGIVVDLEIPLETGNQKPPVQEEEEEEATSGRAVVSPGARFQT